MIEEKKECTEACCPAPEASAEVASSAPASPALTNTKAVIRFKLMLVKVIKDTPWGTSLEAILVSGATIIAALPQLAAAGLEAYRSLGGAGTELAKMSTERFGDFLDVLKPLLIEIYDLVRAPDGLQMLEAQLANAPD